MSGITSVVFFAFYTIGFKINGSAHQMCWVVGRRLS